MSGVITGSAARPLPTPFEWDEGFWSAAQQHRLVVQACSKCNAVRSFPRVMCPVCRCMESHWIDASGKAKLYSWSTLFRSFHPAFTRLPITVAVVELDDFPQVHLVTTLLQEEGKSEADLRIGLPVQVTFTEAAEGFILPQFRLASA